MSGAFVLYGWHLSYFTGKVRCYLHYKGIDFVDQPVDWWTLTRRIKRHTGAVVMPVLHTPQGQWIQDSSVIIDRMEQQFPARSVLPSTPVQRFAAYLLEAWGDEWWVPIAMHTRWSYPENYALFEREAGAALLPHWPHWVRRKAVAYIANTLRGKLHAVGVRAPQTALLMQWTTQMLDRLDAHFALHHYLLGGRPTLADFALVGSMYGHLGRDPWPARVLVAPRQHLRAWIDRMAKPPAAATLQAELLAHDAVAPTLEPVFRAIFAEFVPLLEGIAQQVQALAPHWPHGKPLPRSLGDVQVPLAGGSFARSALPYTLWMAQRVLDVYHAMPEAEQAQVAAWAQPLGGAPLLALRLPRLEQRGLRVALA
ncbi:MAG: glutathione S-transferase family protein [Rhodoferax sp.]